VRGGHTVHRRIIDSMLGEPLDLVAVTGDMVLHGSDDADWQQFFTITGDLLAQVAYLPSVGNHDLGWDAADVARRAQDLFSLPPGPPDRPDGTYWYSFDLADIHLVFLDSNAYERPEQETWLDADLAAARARHVRAILAFTHHGPYSRGYHRGSKIAVERYVPILTKYQIDMIFSGHDHLYQRGEIGGIRYIVSGGGGASLYNAACGTKGRAKCPEDGMQKLAVEHHFIVLTIDKTTLEMCARRPDGSLLEKCVHYPLH
jgi:3',5'-cyclic AMP phosphodiesterase CpdA